MIEIVEVNSFEQLSEYGQQWNTLLQNSDTNVVFLTYEYCRSWWEVYGQNSELLVLLAKKDSEIVGIAPLAISTRNRLGCRTRVVEFLASSRSDYSDFIVGANKESVPDAFYNYLWSISNRWDVIRLRQIPQKSTTIQLSREQLGRSGKSFRVQPASHCPTILLKEHTDEVLKRIKKDKTMRKRINRLKRLGDLTFGHAESVEEGLSYLDIFFQQHINRWESTVTPSFFYSNEPREFYRKLIQRLTPQGWMRLGYLKLDEDCIAFYFAYEYNGSLSTQRPSYDPLYARYSPSRIHIHYAVDYCIERGLKEFDLLAGLEDYKAELANAINYTRSIYIYKSAMQKFCGQLKYAARKSRLFSPIFKGGVIWPLRMILLKYRSRYGTLGMVKKAICRITSHIIDFSSIQFFAWNGDSVPALTAKCPLEIRTGSEADLSRIASFHGLTEDARRIKQFKERLEKGDKPYLGFSGKTLAHVAWLCHRPQVEMGEIWGSLAFRDNEAYIMDCNTFFTFRGKNIYPVVLQRILKDLAAEKVGKVYIGCRTSNKASLKGIRKAGFLPFKKIHAVKLFGKKLGAKTIQLGSG